MSFLANDPYGMLAPLDKHRSFRLLTLGGVTCACCAFGAFNKSVSLLIELPVPSDSAPFVELGLDVLVGSGGELEEVITSVG